ncbi:MAG: amidase family protein [Thermoleophilaceae bacterium]
MSSPNELAFAGVVRQAELVRAGEVSSRELVELYLERIERLDPELNAFRTVLRERALGDAEQADARRAAGADDGERPLLGVPIALKDTEDLAGEVTSWGTAANLTPAARDGELVRRLRAAGRRAPRQDQPARARDPGRHGGTVLRDHTQSMEHGAQPCRL